MANQLHVESVDYNAGRVKITFTDTGGDEVMKLYLTEKEACDLCEAIRSRCYMKARENRKPEDEIPDYNF